MVSHATTDHYVDAHTMTALVVTQQHYAMISSCGDYGSMDMYKDQLCGPSLIPHVLPPLSNLPPLDARKYRTFLLRAPAPSSPMPPTHFYLPQHHRDENHHHGQTGYTGRPGWFLRG